VWKVGAHTGRPREGEGVMDKALLVAFLLLVIGNAIVIGLFLNGDLQGLEVYRPFNMVLVDVGFAFVLVWCEIIPSFHNGK